MNEGLGVLLGMGAMFIFPTIMFAVIICVVVVSLVRASEKHKAKMNRAEVQYADVIQKYCDILTSNPELNAEREKSKRAGKLIWIFIICGFALFFTPLGIAGMIVMVFGIIFCSIKAGNYKKMFKESVITNALKEYDSNLTYNPTGVFPESTYRMARFESYDRYRSEDEIRGFIDGKEFIMADVHTQREHRDKDGHTSYTTVFRGQVALLHLPNTIGFDISVVNNTIKLFSGDTHVEIDNPTFEEHYDVFTSDKIKAMKILTPAVTNKMLDLNNKYGFKFELKIISNQVFFRFYADNLFEPNAADIKAEATGIALYFEILNGIKDMMNELLEAIKKV